MKKSKFQERLDEAARKRRIKRDDPTSQSAQEDNLPPNPLGLQRWKSVQDEKPRYYDPINIWDGKDMYYNWARVACENGDYYVGDCSCGIKTDVTHWSPPAGVDYPPYEPMTTEDIKLFTLRDINDIIKTLEQQNNAHEDNDFDRGYIQAMTECINYLKRTTKDAKLKLHTPK